MSVTAWLRTERDGRLRWWLLPLTWIWACVHGTWLYAGVLAVVVGIGLLLDGRLSRSTATRIGGFVLGAVVLAALTPVGPRLLLTPIAISRVSAFISEWKPTSITDPHAATTVLMGLVVVVTWAVQRERVAWARILLWVLAMGSALMYARTIAVGAIIVAPLFAETVQRFLPERAGSRRQEARTLIVASVVSLVLAAVLVPASARSVNAEKMPTAFDAVLGSMPTGTVVWNVDAVGGWLLYAHPNVWPTMDTRAEAYGPDYLTSYVRAISGFPGWQETVAKSGARYALVDVDGPLAEGLKQQERWTVVSQDDSYALLKAP